MTIQEDTHALAYHHKPNGCTTSEWWFIPTVPEARKWRGPYATERALDDAINAELGDGCTVTVTSVQPSFMRGATEGDD